MQYLVPWGAAITHLKATHGAARVWLQSMKFVKLWLELFQLLKNASERGAWPFLK